MYSVGAGFLGKMYHEHGASKLHALWNKKRATGKKHLNIDTKENAKFLKYSKAIHLYSFAFSFIRCVTRRCYIFTAFESFLRILLTILVEFSLTDGVRTKIKH